HERRPGARVGEDVRRDETRRRRGSGRLLGAAINDRSGRAGCGCGGFAMVVDGRLQHDRAGSRLCALALRHAARAARAHAAGGAAHCRALDRWRRHRAAHGQHHRVAGFRRSDRTASAAGRRRARAAAHRSDRPSVAVGDSLSGRGGSPRQRVPPADRPAGGGPYLEPGRDPFVLDPESRRKDRRDTGTHQHHPARSDQGRPVAGSLCGVLRPGAFPDDPGCARDASRRIRSMDHRSPANRAPMTTAHAEPPDRASLEAVWANPRGWRWASSVNHSAIGLRFMITGLAFFLVAGVLAMLMRAQLARPEAEFIGPAAYNQAFTMHGTMMMFLFAVPMLEGLAVYLIPKMLGARDLAFPRLSAFGYWCYLFGGLVITASLLFDLAPDTGWFMYT